MTYNDRFNMICMELSSLEDDIISLANKIDDDNIAQHDAYSVRSQAEALNNIVNDLKKLWDDRNAGRFPF